MAPLLRCIGRSLDGRTNRWDFTCECKHVHYPPTTMFAKSNITCPNCHREYFVNYNTREIKELTWLK